MNVAATGDIFELETLSHLVMERQPGSALKLLAGLDQLRSEVVPRG